MQSIFVPSCEHVLYAHTQKSDIFILIMLIADYLWLTGEELANPLIFLHHQLGQYLLHWWWVLLAIRIDAWFSTCNPQSWDQRKCSPLKNSRPNRGKVNSFLRWVDLLGIKNHLIQQLRLSLGQSSVVLSNRPMVREGGRYMLQEELNKNNLSMLLYKKL